MCCSKKFQSRRIRVVDNPYLVERECQKCNKMMELSGKESPSLSGPASKFWHKSIFRLCLFLDIWIMVYELQDVVYG